MSLPEAWKLFTHAPPLPLLKPTLSAGNVLAYPSFRVFFTLLETTDAIHTYIHTGFKLIHVSVYKKHKSLKIEVCTEPY